MITPISPYKLTALMPSSNWSVLSVIGLSYLSLSHLASIQSCCSCFRGCIHGVVLHSLCCLDHGSIHSVAFVMSHVACILQHSLWIDAFVMDPFILVCLVRQAVIWHLWVVGCINESSMSHFAHRNRSFLEAGFRSRDPLLICTTISNKTGHLDLYQNMPEVLAARSFLLAGFDTR